MNDKILIIDDDVKLTELLEDYLSNYGFKVATANHPLTGLRLIKQEEPSLIILDVMMPEMDGFELCKKIRVEHDIPVIMLTARGEVTDRIVGLELGADDYLPKPFEPRELVARIQSILRRTAGKKTNSDILRFSNLAIDFNKHEAFLSNDPLLLTSTEFELLALFAKNQGKVMSRDSIMESVRGIEWESFNRSVDVLVSRLRQKLKDDPKHPLYLKTVWGTGYIFLGKEN